MTIIYHNGETRYYLNINNQHIDITEDARCALEAEKRVTLAKFEQQILKNSK